MDTNRFIIGTGYCNTNNKYIDDLEFFTNNWLPNTINLNPTKIVVVNSGEQLDVRHDILEFINLTNKTYHVKDMNHSTDLFGGWSLSFINSALYAYSCKCDFIYKEQDCLTFGDIIPESCLSIWNELEQIKNNN